ncbi:MAG TPA: cytochrome P450, partial [Solirubrobacteraceae bacterium]|nr:cytochrome P450 [Solirubrobacteraceae bacterium]
LEDPSLVPAAVEESLRMFPAFAHFARTATRDTELHGQRIREGEKLVMWYPSSNRDEMRFEDPDRFDLRRWPKRGCPPKAGVTPASVEHQAFGAGGRHFCLGTALARLELRILIEETLKRYPEIQIAGECTHVESAFANQHKTLPVRLGP